MLPINQLIYISETCEQQELDAIWGHFAKPGGFPTFEHELMTFEERREGFLWTLKRLLQNGLIVLPRWSDGSWLEGTPEEQIDAIRKVFPTDDEGMKDSYWFYPPGCPVGVLWEWPGRDPQPFTD